MSTKRREFWTLAVESGLISAEDGRRLDSAYRAQKATAEQPLRFAPWLLRNTALTPYQLQVLAGGQPGPFRFGDYLVVDRVVEGRLRGLFRARHVASGHSVALSFLRGEATRRSEVLAELARLVAAAARCTSDALTACYELVDLGAYKFVVVEDLAGQSLEEQLRARTGVRWSVPLALDAACRLLEALSVLHAAEQVHGAVRPANVWCADDRPPRLMHIPLADDLLERAQHATTATRADRAPLEQRAAQQADYLAPELQEPGRSVEPPSDLYAVGCVLYELLAGRPPFAGGDVRSKLERHTIDDPPPLAKVRSDLPAPAVRLVEQLLVKDPSQRPQHAREVADLIRRWLGPEPLGPVSPPPPATLATYRAHLTAAARLTENMQTAGPNALAAGIAAPATTTVDGSLAAPRSRPPVETASLPQSPRQPRSQPIGQAPLESQPQQAARAAPLGPQIQPTAADGVARNDATMFSATDTAPGPTERLRSRQQRRAVVPRWVWPAGGVVAAILLAAVAYWALSPGGDGPGDVAEGDGARSSLESAAGAGDQRDQRDQRDQQQRDSERTADSRSDGGADVAPTDGAHSVASDAAAERALWESPTAGRPLELKYLPPGAQVILAWRPAEVLAHPEGQKLLDTLGSWGQRLRDDLAEVSASDPLNIEQMWVALLDNGPEPPLRYIAVRTIDPVAANTWRSSWGNPRPTALTDGTVLEGAQRSYYLPAADERRWAIVAPPNEARSLAEQGEEPVPLISRELESLARASDSERHFTLFVVPSFLRAGGRWLLEGETAALAEPLDWFWGYDSRAVLVSGHLDENLFLEIRVHDLPEQRAAVLTQELLARVADVPQRVARHVGGLTPSPYGRAVLERFPAMVEALTGYTRGAALDRHAVLRAYLPAVAAHNLTLGTYVALVEQQADPATAAAAAEAARAGGRHRAEGAEGAVAAMPDDAAGGAATGTPASPADSPPAAAPSGAAPGAETMRDSTPDAAAASDERLSRTISLRFPRNTLEGALNLLADEIELPIEILGGDLELEGITRNQSFALDLRDLPAHEVLRGVLRQASPEGKLVWVLKSDNDGRPVIFVTTRAAALSRGDPLPPGDE